MNKPYYTAAIGRWEALTNQLSPPFQRLVATILDLPEVSNNLLIAPSSCKGHHSQRGGNLEHTVEVAEVALAIAQTLDAPVDRDVLIVAALMHDIGKVTEYEMGPEHTRMSTQGRLVGHKMTGFELVTSALRTTEGITEAQQLGLRNCFIASEGKPGDTRGQATLEGFIVSRADQLSAHLDLFRRSQRQMKSANGLGVRHDHMKETPFHIKPKLTPEPVPGTAPPQTAMQRLLARSPVWSPRNNRPSGL